MDPKTGIISTSGLIDRENLTPDSFTLNVIATDNGRPLRQSSASVLVTIEDINDNIPQFLSSTWEIYLNDNFKANETFRISSAVDKDVSAAFKVIEYGALTHTLNTELFVFNAQEDELGVTTISNCSEFCDRPENISYSFSIFAYNPGYETPSNISQYLEVRLVIVYTDPNLHSPRFTEDGPIERTVSRNIGIGAEVLTVTASDDDSGPEGEITFVLFSSNLRVQSIFNISTVVNGRATVTLQFEFDDADEYQFMINATDRARRPKSTMLEVIIKVVGVQEPCQDFTVLIVVCVAGAFILIPLIAGLVWEIHKTRSQEDKLNKYYHGERVDAGNAGPGYNEISGNSGYDQLDTGYTSASGLNASGASQYASTGQGHRRGPQQRETTPSGANNMGHTKDGYLHPRLIPRPKLTVDGLAALKLH